MLKKFNKMWSLLYPKIYVKHVNTSSNDLVYQYLFFHLLSKPKTFDDALTQLKPRMLCSELMAIYMVINKLDDRIKRKLIKFNKSQNKHIAKLKYRDHPILAPKNYYFGERLTGYKNDFNIMDNGKRLFDIKKSTHLNQPNAHANIGASRATAKKMINTYVSMCDLEPYWIGASAVDSGYLQPYSDKDLKYHAKLDILPHNACYCFSDTDLHVNMDIFLSTGRPIAITGSAPFYFGLDLEYGEIDMYPVSENSTRTNVLGGGHYYDQIYNYSKHDHLSTITYNGKVVVYDVDYKVTSWDDRRFICFLTPHIQDLKEYDHYDESLFVKLTLPKRLKYSKINFDGNDYYYYIVQTREDNYINIGSNSNNFQLPLDMVAVAKFTNNVTFESVLADSKMVEKLNFCDIHLLINICKNIDLTKVDRLQLPSVVLRGESKRRITLLEEFINATKEKVVQHGKKVRQCQQELEGNIGKPVDVKNQGKIKEEVAKRVYKSNVNEDKDEIARLNKRKRNILRDLRRINKRSNLSANEKKHLQKELEDELKELNEKFKRPENIVKDNIKKEAEVNNVIEDKVKEKNKKSVPKRIVEVNEEIAPVEIVAYKDVSYTFGDNLANKSEARINIVRKKGIAKTQRAKLKVEYTPQVMKSKDVRKMFNEERKIEKTEKSRVYSSGIPMPVKEQRRQYETPKTVAAQLGKDDKVPKRVYETNGTEAVVPITTDIDNFNAGIMGRVVLQNRDGTIPAVCNKKEIREGYKFADKFRQFAEEFVDYLTTGITLEKYSDAQLDSCDFVNDNVREKFHAFDLRGPNKKIKINATSFIKKEAYNDKKDPRMITQMDIEYMLKLAKFTYPAKKKILKNMPWYAPGHSGDEMNRFVEKLIMSDRIVATDYSRFDGTQSKLIRSMFEEAFYLKVFPQHKKELEELFNMDYDAKILAGKIKGKFQIQYKTKGERLSGSSLTTDGNTINNAGIFYTSLRILGYSKQQALFALENSIFYGDDAVLSLEMKSYNPTYNIPEEDLVKAITSLGMNLKLERCDIHCIPFCSRFYDIPHRASVPDLKRALPKMLLSYDNDPRTPEQQIFDRIYGYYVNDPEHPVIKAYYEVIALGLMKDGKAASKTLLKGEEIFKINQGAYEQGNPDPLIGIQDSELHFGSFDQICQNLVESRPIY
uniref:RNA-directed RNA polymerase n=1 Tax=Sheep associated noda-like virus TaxID=2796362 RepID=A0A8E0NAI2_9VIRU|nr:TPA: RNA-dependent RNA polymerase [Sheep associated noda-like virus]